LGITNATSPHSQLKLNMHTVEKNRSPVSTWWVFAFGLLAVLGALVVLSTDAIGAARTLGVLGMFGAAFFVPDAIRGAYARLARLRHELSWWHWLWLIALLSSLVFRIRDTREIEHQALDFWALYRVALLLVVAMTLWRHLRGTSWIRPVFQGIIGLLAVYALVAMASTVWSVKPSWTAYKSVEYFVDLVLLATIVRFAPDLTRYKTLLDWTWVMMALLLVTVWIGTFVWPDRALLRGGDLLGPRIAGVFPALDQNTVGEYGAILAIVAMVRRWRNPNRAGRVFYLAVFVFGLVTLLRSQTRVAIFGFVLGAALLLIIGRRLKTLALLVVVVASLFAFTDIANVAEGIYNRGDRKAGLESLSGRLPKWELAFEQISKRPITGYGAYAAERFMLAPQMRGLRDMKSTDVLNTYIEVLSGTGLLGLLPFVAALAATWFWLMRATRFKHLSSPEHLLVLECLGVLAIITARTLSSVRLINHTALLGLVVIGCAELIRRNYARRTVKRAGNRNAASA